MKKLNIEYWKKLLETVAFSYGKIGLYELVQKEHKHFHPSGKTEPSENDMILTKRIAEAGDICGFDMIEHVIIGHGDNNYFSFCDNDLI